MEVFMAYLTIIETSVKELIIKLNTNVEGDGSGDDDSTWGKLGVKAKLDRVIKQRQTTGGV